jgi:NOL1/NOP2/fmu family ribosome biogenesis protein
MFRKNPQAAEEWGTEQVAACAARQAEILNSAASCVKPGGILLYSTCTFSLEENEGNVQKLLANHPDFELIAINHPGGRPGYPLFEGAERCRRIYPMDEGEGHFVAVLRKLDGEPCQTPLQAGEKLPKLWSEFARELDIVLPEGKALSFGQSLYWVPTEFPDIKGIRVLRPGLELGEVKKDRFEPAHALALWLKTAGRTEDLPAESTKMQAYLRGETVESQHRGWTLIRCDSYSIGWGKGDGKVLKNHYPKGLRR